VTEALTDELLLSPRGAWRLSARVAVEGELAGVPNGVPVAAVPWRTPGCSARSGRRGTVELPRCKERSGYRCIPADVELDRRASDALLALVPLLAKLS